MFGSKRNKNENRIREIFDRIYQQRVTFETSLTEVEDGRERIYNDVEQVMTNTTQIVNNAMLNIEEESAMILTIDDFSRELKSSLDKYGNVQSEIVTQLKVAAALVEQNKHFTTPAKYLSEVPNTLKQSCESYEKQLDDMTEQGKQMGVLALNAAIEAGRLGESGKSFVLAAEEIRQNAVNCEKAASAMKEEVIASREKIAELEDTIQHLISLMKDNNVGTAKLFKKCHETQTFMASSEIPDFSDDLIFLRDKVVNMRNLDEEIAKCGERNKIQISDIQEDMQNQKHEIAEMESDLLHLLDSLEEQFG